MREGWRAVRLEGGGWRRSNFDVLTELLCSAVTVVAVNLLSLQDR